MMFWKEVSRKLRGTCKILVVIKDKEYTSHHWCHIYEYKTLLSS